MVEPVFDKINYNQKKGEVKEQIKVEVKTDVRTEDVTGILSVSPWVNLNESELETEKLNYNGRIIFYVSYLNADSAIKKCECGSEFSGTIKNEWLKDTCRVATVSTVDKVEADTSGTYLSITAYLTISAQITDCNEVNALTGGDDLVVKTDEINCVKSLGVKRGSYPIEEEFELSYPIEEVLFHRADGVITAVQSGVGSVIVDGEVLLSLVLLQKNDKNDIIRENRILPFRMEIECEEAMPNMQATAKVREKSFKTDVSVDEETGKSTVNVSVSLAFEGEVFTNSCVKVVLDAFSTDNEVELEYDKFPSYKTCDLRSYTEVVNGRSTVNELPVGAVLLAVGGEKATVVSAQCESDGVCATGVLTATAFFKDSENKVFVRKLEVPFDVKLNGAFDCNVQTEIIAKAEKASAKIVSISEIELETEIFFTVYPVEKYENKVVKELRVVGEKQKNTCAISVYMPEEGEELWSLSKRLNVCPDQLVATNKELQFPLTGKERIVVYRRK